MIRQPTSSDQRRLQRGQNQRIYEQMRRHFAPASIMPAPNSNPQANGGRNTVLTAQNSANSAPTDSATLAFVPDPDGAYVTWQYKTKFKSPPNVTATPVGPPPTPGTTPTWHLKGPGSNVAVIVISTDPADNRLVNLHAVGAPD
jgi:hypothetical protein